MCQTLVKTLHALILINLFLFTSIAYPLKEDTQKTLYIVADATLFNFKTGLKIYEGNVKVDQGTTHLTADKIITKENKFHKIEEVIAYGIKSQAHYTTLVKENDPVMHAYAKIIKYFPMSSDVILKDEVNVMQGENQFTGSYVLYNNEQQTITVPKNANGRAKLIYNPDSN